MEVALRNCIHDQLVNTVGYPNWWDGSKLVLSDRLQGKVAEAVDFAKRQAKGNEPSADDVVGASSFGMWTSVLHSENAQGLWRGCLENAFQGGVKRGPLFDGAFKLKKLRDRIAHHEPIWNLNQDSHLRKLDTVMGVIHEDLPAIMGEWFPSLRSCIDSYEDALDLGIVDL